MRRTRSQRQYRAHWQGGEAAWNSAPLARPVELARLVVEMVAERIEALLAGAGARLVGEAPAGGGLLAQLLCRLRAPLARAARLGGIIEWHSGGPFRISQKGRPALPRRRAGPPLCAQPPARASARTARPCSRALATRLRTGDNARAHAPASPPPPPPAPVRHGR